MIRRILAAYRAEWVKYLRLPLPYLGLMTVILMVCISTLVYPIRQDNHSDFAFIGTSIPAVMNLAGFLMILVYSATLIVSEVDSGTIRLVLSRPIERHEFLLAKLLNGMTYAALLSLATVATAWIVAMIGGELTGVAFGNELIYAQDEMYIAMGLALLINLLSHFAGVAYAIFVSTFVRRPPAAIGLAVGGWLLIDYAKHPLGIAAGFFTTYLDEAWLVFQDRCNALETPFFPTTLQGLGVSAAWFAAFVLASIFIIGRRSFGP